MSPVPVMGSVGTELYEALEPLAAYDEQHDYALAHVCEAIGRMWQDVEDLIRDTDEGPGWSALVDIDRAPAFAFPWLAQIAGVKLTQGASVQQQREEIRRVDGQSRGRPATIISRVQDTLTGAKSVRLVERPGDEAYQFTVITRTAETPDPTATVAAIRAAKPAGLVFTHIVSDAPLIDEGTLSIDSVPETIDAATVADVT